MADLISYATAVQCSFLFCLHKKSAGVQVMHTNTFLHHIITILLPICYPRSAIVGHSVQSLCSSCAHLCRK